jgi:hypothetical protein
LFWGFFRWISVQLSNLFNYWVIKLLILTISAYIAFVVFYKAFSVALEEGGGVSWAIFSFFLRIFAWSCVIYVENLMFSYFRDEISILSYYISITRGFRASVIACWISSISRVFFGFVVKRFLWSASLFVPFWTFKGESMS